MGIYFLDNRPVKHTNLEEMVDVLAHRGPDGADIWVNGCIGFGHRILWTTPESLLEKQPLINQTGLVITSDSRIDNRDELIVALQFDNCPPEKISDTELILAAYEKWGEQCTKHLLGDFAFAIWDDQQQKLFCARDHFGVKPFYYYLSNFLEHRTFAFASEIKAIFCLPEVSRQLNEVRIGDYLITNFDDKTLTSYQNILRLPPAHQMTISCRGINIKPYWSLELADELHLDSDEEYAAKFREIFTEAVRCRLRSAYAVGSRLSGGLDSSSITCTAEQILKQDNKEALHTFSIIYGQVTECDELSFINTVLAQGNYIPHFIYGDQYSPLADIENILWHQDEAFYAPGLATTWQQCLSAKEKSVRVLLDGHDGDGVVSHGFGYLQELARAGHWWKLAIEIRGVAKMYNESFWSSFWNYVQFYGIKSVSQVAVFKIVNRIWRKLQRGKKQLIHNIPTKSSDWSTILNPDFIERIGLKERYEALQKLQIQEKTEREDHYQTINHGQQVFALEVLDKVAAASSIEFRYPFWDKRLVEFCLSLPPQQKLHQGWSRMIMRRAMTNILPKEIQWRRNKTNFLPNLSYGLLTFERNLMELIVNDIETIKEYLNTKSLQKIHHDFINLEKINTKNLFSIWGVISLAVWLRFLNLRNLCEKKHLSQ